MGKLLEARREISLVASLLAGLILRVAPFPSGDWLFQILRDEKPMVFYLLAGLHHLFLFTTPFWVVSGLLSCVYTLRRGGPKPIGAILLPPLPQSGEHLQLVMRAAPRTHPGTRGKA